MIEWSTTDGMPGKQLVTRLSENIWVYIWGNFMHNLIHAIPNISMRKAAALVFLQMR